MKPCSKRQVFKVCQFVRHSVRVFLFSNWNKYWNKYNQDLWNDGRNNTCSHIAARIIHIDNEEKKKIRRLREQARAAQPRDNDSDNNDSDN